MRLTHSAQLRLCAKAPGDRAECGLNPHLASGTDYALEEGEVLILNKGVSAQ